MPTENPEVGYVIANFEISNIKNRVFYLDGSVVKEAKKAYAANAFAYNEDTREIEEVTFASGATNTFVTRTGLQGITASGTAQTVAQVTKDMIMYKAVEQ